MKGPFQIKLVVPGGRKAEQGQHVQTEEQVALDPSRGSHTGSGKSWGWGLGTRLQRGRANTEGSCLRKVLSEQGHISVHFLGLWKGRQRQAGSTAPEEPSK